MKRKLYALHVNVWDMDSYIAFRDGADGRHSNDKGGSGRLL